MAIEMNIPAVIAKAKAKVALLEKLVAEQNKNEEDYQKQVDATRETRSKEYDKWALGIVKQALRKASKMEKVNINNTWRGLSVELLLPKGLLDVAEQPNWDNLYPYPERKTVEFPKMFDRNGKYQSVDQAIHDLKNSIEWLGCIEPGTKFTVSEFNRITASL